MESGKQETLFQTLLEWYKSNQFNNEEIPEVNLDVIGLTLLLKSTGLRLDFLDFDSDTMMPEANQELKIEIKCNKSGIVSKLSGPITKCLCPRKTSENNNSFWEVQATAPGTPNNRMIQDNVQERSSNLLPALPKVSMDLSKILIDVILSLQRNDSNSIDKIPISQTEGQNDDTNDKKLFEKLSMDINKMRKMMEEAEENNNQAVRPPTIAKEIVTIKTEQADSPSHKTNSPELFIKPNRPDLITSSPNEFPMNDNDRDINLIKTISQARQYLDTALFLLKFNITQDISHPSILTVTPQKIGNLEIEPHPELINKSDVIPSIGIKGKKHLTAIPSKRKQFLSPNNKVTTRRSLSSIPAKVQTNLNLERADTPRPENTNNLVKKVVTNNVRKVITGSAVSKISLKKSTLSQSMPKLPTTKK